jgi:uncharacterized protein YdiU (UPF0061 family)
LKFYNSYIELGAQFFQRVSPDKVPKPTLLLWNNVLADDLSITPALQNDHELLAKYGSGNELPNGVNSIALAYSGHQFGHFNPNLGDGRAHLLGEMVDKKGIRRDIQLKGSGQTVFSRRGDGKCALAPALREYMMSEALYALGVPTSRCLAVVGTGELINRGLAKPGAVVTRVAASHIRVGTFQYFAARGDIDSLTALLDYTIERHFPEIDDPSLNNADADGAKISNQKPSQEQRILQFLEKAIDKQITLITQWLRIGFIHGVMNTDNTAISGETIDFGPCAMMGVYDNKASFSSIDEYGRYAFGNQGKIGQWNMARLADCLLLLLNDAVEKGADLKSEDNNIEDEVNQEKALESIEALIHRYTSKFDQAYYAMYAEKLGITDVGVNHITLINDLLAMMQTQKLDYTQTFNALTQSLSDSVKEKALVSELGSWYQSWLDTLTQLSITKPEAESLMSKSNPLVIPRNHHIEELLDRCELIVTNNMNSNTSNNLTVSDIVNDFLHVICSPYKELTNTKYYQDAPQDKDQYYQTFCGT